MISEKYFDAKGLTSTSANYLANIAQECITSAKTKLANLRFYKETLVLLGTGKEQVISNSHVLSTDEIKNLVHQISQMNAFCAWIREAIKAKEVLQEDFPSFDEWKADKQTVESPADRMYWTEADIIAELDIKQLNHYYTLEAYASTLGKLIHRDGAISNARSRLLKVIENPSEINHLDSDVVITRYDAIANPEKIEEFYVQLQNQYREYERQLNQIKYQIKEEVSKRNREAQNEYTRQLRAYNDEQQELYSDYQKEKEEHINKIAQLKIVVPNDLEDTFKYLQQLGK